MANQNYSSSEAQDLVNNLKAVFVFIESGVPEHDLPSDVMDTLLRYVSSSVDKLSLVLRG